MANILYVCCRKHQIYIAKLQIHETTMLPIFVSNVCIPTKPCSIALRNAWKVMAAHMLATLGNNIWHDFSINYDQLLWKLRARVPRPLRRSKAGKGTNSLWFQLERVHGAKQRLLQIGSALVSRYGFRWLGANIPLSNFEENLAGKAGHPKKNAYHPIILKKPLGSTGEKIIEMR